MSYLLLVFFLSAFTLGAQPGPGAGSIEGHVLNSLTNSPIRKATVILEAPQIRLVAETDADGSFQFLDLPPGAYRLSASRGGFQPRRAHNDISLGPKDRITDASIRLRPLGVIAGRVVDEESEPVDLARVSIYQSVYREGIKRWENLHSTTTNDRGEYRLPNLKPGRYLLQAYGDRAPASNRYGTQPDTFYPPTYYPNALTRQQAAPVEVEVGTQLDGIDIRLGKVARPPSFRVKGKVVGLPPGSRTVVGVSLHPSDGGIFGGGSTIAEPPDFAFDLSAPAGGYVISGNTFSDGPEVSGTGTISVTADVAGEVLAVSPAPEISGRVRVTETGPKKRLEGVRVILTRLSDVGFQVHELRSDISGRFRSPKPLRPDSYAITNVHSLPEDCYVSEITLDGQQISPESFEIRASGNLEIVLAGTAGQITGSVSGADGKPSQRAVVTLIPEGAQSWPAKKVADDAGSFHFLNLRPGKYTLWAWEEVDEVQWRDPEHRKKYEGRATEITIGASERRNVPLRVIAEDEMK